MGDELRREVNGLEKDCKQKDSLIRRAAELLRHWAHQGGPGEDMMALAAWMRDAGAKMEEE